MKKLILSILIFLVSACSTPALNKDGFKPVPSITSGTSLTMENCDKQAWIGAFEFGTLWDDAPIYIKGEGTKTIQLKAGDYRVFRYYPADIRKESDRVGPRQEFPEYKDITIVPGTSNMVSLGCDD